MAGTYTFSRRKHTISRSLFSCSSEPFSSLTVMVPSLLNELKGTDEQPKKWREIAPFVWRNAVGGDRLAAKVENGRVVRFGYDEYPFMLFEPVPWWWSSGWLLPLWIAGLVALALTTLAWPTSALVRRRYGV